MFQAEAIVRGIPVPVLGLDRRTVEPLPTALDVPVGGADPHGQRLYGEVAPDYAIDSTEEGEASRQGNRELSCMKKWCGGRGNLSRLKPPLLLVTHFIRHDPIREKNSMTLVIMSMTTFPVIFYY